MASDHPLKYYHEPYRELQVELAAHILAFDNTIVPYLYTKYELQTRREHGVSAAFMMWVKQTYVDLTGRVSLTSIILLDLHYEGC